jgi:ABC-type polysaccharide/polyol phosphate export permease
VTSLAEYRRSRELAVNLVLRELRSRYKRTALGYRC